MTVTDVLRDRMREPEGAQQAVASSLAALLHAALFVVLVLAPHALFPTRSAPPRTTMTITLGGGAGGPDNGGMTSIGGRPVQVQRPDPPARPEPVRPPAAKT